MRAETYLRQIEESECRIENKIAEIQRLEALADDISPHLSEVKVSSTPDPHRAQEVWIRLIDARDELMDEVNELLDLKREITQTLEKLPAENYDVLFNIYVLKKPVQRVADEMRYTRQAIYYIRDRGLEELQKILDFR
jgi:DNA-directed RNA polymerase specialized sigma24 family protein